MPRGVKRFGSRSRSSRHCFDEPQLVGGVVDREVRAVAEPLRLAAQDAAAGGVERHHPRRAGRRPDEILDPLAHLGGRLVRERDREDLGRLHADRGEQMRDAAGEHAGLARARAGDHEHRPFGRRARPPAAPDSGLRSTSRASSRPRFDRSGGPGAGFPQAGPGPVTAVCRLRTIFVDWANARAECPQRDEGVRLS